MINPIALHNNKLLILDQTRLPGNEVYIEVECVDILVDSINRLAIRGAPLLGIAAAYGFFIGVSEYDGNDYAGFRNKCRRIKELIESTRPTAVNLSRSLNQLLNLVDEMKGRSIQEIKDSLLNKAKSIHETDRLLCEAIGEIGNSLVPNNASILTHCNAGALATGGIGTALGVIVKAHQAGKKVHVYVDETRPLLQGARLTTWELQQHHIPMTLITDNMAASLMKRKRIDLVIVGADRIASNGDTANKIGTYSLAVLCAFHKVPLYIAAPETTFDLSIENGDQIPIEMRDGTEIIHCAGKPVAPSGTNTYSPAFDVTPNDLIQAIITEKGIIEPPFDENIKTIFNLES
ncbi:S-methyl-5-thioribose-1-phosphate isomerase [bacterium]|nr:S-methyl-5-thioribose-1-phosphate isomerase [bacterium]